MFRTIARGGLLAFVTLASLVWSGCAKPTATTESKTRTVQGIGGDAFDVPDPIRGLVPGNGSALDLLAALVSPAEVVGLPADSLKYSNVPDEQREAWAARPVLANLHLEELLSGQVDLVVGHDWQRAQLEEVFRDTPIYAVYLPTASTFEDLIAGVRLAGRALQTETKADALVTQLEELRATMKSRGTTLAGRRALVYSNYGAVGVTAGSGTSYDVMVRLTGMDNAATVAGLEGHPDVDVEGLLAIDPDFLVLSGTSPEDSPSLASLLSALQDTPLRAVQQERYLFLPSNHLTTTSHYVVFAAQMLQEQALAIEASEPKDRTE